MINAMNASIAVEQGIVAAQESVTRWSDGYLWLGDVGAEGVMHSHICEELHRAGAGSVYVEGAMAHLKDGVTRGTGVRGATPHALRGGGRGDIHLVSIKRKDDWAPYGIVEVKRLQSSSGWRSDLSRLCTAMKKYGQKDHELNFACLGLYLETQGKTAFNRSVKRLEDLVDGEFRDEFSSLKLKLCSHGEQEDRIAGTNRDGEYFWGALTVSIVRKSMHFTRT
jgi:hypothetical protein